MSSAPVGTPAGVPLRVIVVAADALVRAGLRTYLHQQPRLEVVAELDAGDSGAEMKGAQVSPSGKSSKAKNWAELYRPDAALWEMGWQEPAETLARLGEMADAGIPTLVLRGETGDVAQGDQSLWIAGARGILSRRATGEQLAIALEAIAHGLRVQEYASDDVRGNVGQVSTLAATEDEMYETLTPRERAVLEAIADGMSNKQIAPHLGMSEHTVKFHVNSILGKLHAVSRTDAVVRATRAGILAL